MLFAYKAVDKANAPREGTVEAASVDAATQAVKKRGYTVLSIDESNQNSTVTINPQKLGLLLLFILVLAIALIHF